MPSPALSESGSLAGVPPMPGRELVVNLTAVDRIIARTPFMALGRYRCPVSHPQFEGGGPQACHYIVFPRRVVRICLAGARPEVAAPGTLRFYNEGDRYERTQVGGEADESDWVALAPGILESLAAGLISSGYKDAVAFVILMALVILSPGGFQ